MSANSRLLNALKLWTQLHRLAREVSAAERELASPLGLSLVQGQALLALADGGALSMQEFAERLCIAPSTATRLADQLEQKGWASRRLDAGDRRRTELALAPAGERVVDGLVDRGVSRTLGLLRSLQDPDATARELEVLARGLRDLRARKG